MAFRLGIIGSGWITQECILPALREQNDLELVGIWDINPAARKAAASGFAQPMECQSEEELWQRKPDAIYIGTSNAFHVPAALTALRHDCAVLVEKPLCCSVAEADALLDAS